MTTTSISTPQAHTLAPFSSSLEFDAGAPSKNQSLTSSLAVVLGKLSGKKITKTQLANMKFSEEILYAAGVHEQLSKTSKPLMKTFEGELKLRYDRRTVRSDTQPIAKAINDILDNGVKAKAISQKQYESILSNALGHAQLNSLRGEVNTNVVNGGLDKALKISEKNRLSTSKELEGFEKSVSTLTFQTPATTRAQAEKMKKIFDSLTSTSSALASTKSTNSSDTKTKAETTTEKTDEVSKKIEVVDPTLNSSPNHFDYRGKSDSNNKMLIRLPVNFGKEVASVEIKDSLNHVLENQVVREVGTDERLYFRFKKQGSSYGDSFTVNIKFQNGSDLPLVIENSKQNFSRGYSG